MHSYLFNQLYTITMSPKTKHYPHWFLLTIRGVFLIIFGIYAFSLSAAPKIPFIRIFEIFTILSGLLLIQNALLNRNQKNWYFTMFNGILDLSLGILLFFLPPLGILDLKIILGIWFLYSGLIQGIDSFVLIHDNVKNWWFELISGGLSFIMAFIIIALRVTQKTELFWFVGVFSIIYGVFIIISSYSLRKM